MIWNIHDFKNSCKFTNIIGNFARHLLGFQANSLPSCADKLRFTKGIIFSLLFSSIYLQNKLSYSTEEKEINSFKWRSTSNEAMCRAGTNRYSCSDLTYKLGSVHEHEEPTNVLDMTTSVLEKENIASLELMFETMFDVIMVFLVHFLIWPMLLILFFHVMLIVLCRVSNLLITFWIYW